MLPLPYLGMPTKTRAKTKHCNNYNGNGPSE